MRNYVIDFYCPETCLAVELDGAVHEYHNQKKRDTAKDSELKKLKIHVLRIKNVEVFEDIDGVCEKIKNVCDTIIRK